MLVKFPVVLAWRRVSAGSRCPVTVTIDGKECLAIFEGDGERMRFYMECDASYWADDTDEPMSATALHPFLAQYHFVIVNPGGTHERVIDARELRQQIDGGG